MKQVLQGGKADKMSPEDFDQNELRRGVKHELEHTSSRAIALEIAMDHLAEDPAYYSHLEAMEKRVRSHRTNKSRTRRATSTARRNPLRRLTRI